MNLTLGRIASILVVAVGWLVAGVTLVLDLIGYATVPEDVQVDSGVLRDLLLWLLSVPWWVPWGFALLSTLTLLAVSWPRARVEVNQGAVFPVQTRLDLESSNTDELGKIFMPDIRNISGTTITNKTIQVQDLVDEYDPYVRNVIFDKCTLLGPCVITISGGQFSDTKIIGVVDIEHAMIETPQGSIVTGIISFEHCIFRETRFKNIAFIGHLELMNHIRRHFQTEEKESIFK